MSNMHVENIFETMEYGPVSHSDKEAKAWIESHQGEWGSFINLQQWKSNSCAKSDVIELLTKEKLATVNYSQEDLVEAVRSSREGNPDWFSTSALARSQILKNVATTISKHSNILATLESISTGRLIKHVQTSIIPQAVRQFQYIASWPYVHQNENKNYKPLGVYVIVMPANSSLGLVAQKLAPAVAAGNGAVLYLDGSLTNANLALYYLAELLSKDSFPPGVFNLVFNKEPLWKVLPTTTRVDGITYVGDSQGAQELKQFTSGSGTTLNLFLNFQHTVIIFECGDIESAVEAAVEAIKMYLENKSACMLLIQESVYTKVLRLLKLHVPALRTGSSLDLTADLGPLATTNHGELVECFYNIDHACTLQYSIGGLNIAPFRTSKEALELANDCCTDVRASIWTETVTLALEVAKNLKASTVWVNCINQYDASVTVGNRKQSGGARDLGDEAFYQYVKHSYSDFAALPFGTVTAETISSYENKNGNSFEMAVDLATRAQLGWNGLGRVGRGKVLWGALDALAEGRQQFQERIKTMKCSSSSATATVEGAIGLLHYWASRSDDGRVYNVNFRGNVVKIAEPVGVVVIVLSDGIQFAVFTFMALVLSAVAQGNAVVVIPGNDLSALASSTLQFLTRGGLPSGVVNILSENAETWLPSIFSCDVQDVWYIGPEVHLAAADFLSAQNRLLQPICGRTSFNTSLWDSPKLVQEFFVRARQSKTLWMPSGVTFAN